MADLMDKSDEQNEAAIAARLNYRMPEGPVATGKCLYCNSPLPHGVRWCDAGCRDDWEGEQK